MCWSGEASTVLAGIGFASTAYAVYKKEPAPLWIALGYFTLMEALQAFTYSVIDECTNPVNQVATLLGYLHITFQPFFINMVSMYFIPEKIRKKIEMPVYFLCFVTAIFMLIQLYPFTWAGACDSARPLCGKILCSVSGNWHIAWEVPTNGIGNYFAQANVPFLKEGFFMFTIIGFFLPFLYGSWRFTLYHYFMGPFLAKLSTDNVNEQPAVWCLFSIALLLIVVKTRIRNYLHVKKWIFWPKKFRGFF